MWVARRTEGGWGMVGERAFILPLCTCPRAFAARSSSLNYQNKTTKPNPRNSVFISFFYRPKPLVAQPPALMKRLWRLTLHGLDFCRAIEPGLRSSLTFLGSEEERTLISWTMVVNKKNSRNIQAKSSPKFDFFPFPKLNQYHFLADSHIIHLVRRWNRAIIRKEKKTKKTCCIMKVAGRRFEAPSPLETRPPIYILIKTPTMKCTLFSGSRRLV